MNTSLLTHRRSVTAAIIAGIVLLGVAIGIAGSTPADAHHSTIVCADRSTSTWTVENSENRPMTYTTDAGHSGSIGPRGTAHVVHAATTLTVQGVWDNGTLNTSTGQGDCVPETTTTTTVAETTTTATVPVTTTPACQGICEPATPPSTVPLPDVCFMRDGSILPEGEYVEGVGTGTTRHHLNWCGPPPAVAPPPAAAVGETAAPVLPATGPWEFFVVCLAAAVVTLFGWSLCRAAKRGDELSESGAHFEGEDA